MSFLTGKTAIITGAGYAALENGKCGSIGYGIATAFAKEGANLVITGRNQQKLDQAKSKLEEQYNIKVLVISADVSAGSDNRAIVQQVIDKTIATFGRIDVLINAAQASASGVTLQDHTDSQFDLAIYSGMADENTTPMEATEKFIEWIYNANKEMGIPLNINEIVEEDIEGLATLAEKEANPLYPVPKLMGKEELKRMYHIIKIKESRD